MRKTKEEAAITRKHLLDAALDVFSRKGFSDASLEDVAAQAGVTRGALYHHFGGKVELFDALIQERFGGANRLYEEIVSQGASPRQTLRNLMVRLLEFLEEDSDYRSIQDLLLFKVAFAPELEKSMQQKVQNLRDSLIFLTGLIRSGQAAGEFRPDLDPQDAALGALGLLNGLSTQWLMDPREFSLRERAAGVVDVFMNGLEPHN